MQRMLPHPLLSLFLLSIWLLLNNTVAAGHIILGGFLAVLIPFVTAGFWPEKISIRKPWVFIRFLAVVLWDIVIANFVVALQILRPKQLLNPGFISIPLDIRSPVGISLLANTISLTPGTVSCDLSEDHQQLLIHALHIDDVDSTIKTIKQRYEQPLMEVLESC